MSDGTYFDAYVVGAGPNGLAAAINLAEHGLKVKIVEAMDTVGGGTRTLGLTEPGFLHDVCSAVHPTAVASPFFKTLPLQKYGLEWLLPEVQAAHPLENARAVIIERSLENTVHRLGDSGREYRELFEPFVNAWPELSSDIFGNMRIPNHPFILARFGWYAMFSAAHLSKSFFKSEDLRTYFAGLAAHSIIPLEKAFTSAIGLVLGTSVHTSGWPVAKGGSQAITRALAGYFAELGGVIETGRRIESMEEFPAGKTILFDLTPQQIAVIARKRLPKRVLSGFKRYKYGPGVFKMDFALSEPVPWLNEEVKKAGTVHLGATFEEISASEQAAWSGRHSEKPYVLLAQQSAVDATRAPAGKHTLWAYCHVPSGSTRDMSAEIEAQIERFAPGFKDIIIAKSAMNSVDFEQYNSNYIGGDINGGAQIARQIFGRPLLQWDPYRLGKNGVYICSSSSPPGGGVHGMCGFNASKSVLKNEFGIK